MKINIHAGHNPDGKTACGAVGILKESTQARVIVKETIAILKAAGHTVHDCTCNNGTSQSDVLSKIVKKCNAHDVDIDVSVHLNSGAGDKKGNGKTTGTEVLIAASDSKAKAAAERTVKEIASLGFKNRGVKVRSDLYVLKHTKAPAMLIESCFVDDKDDTKLFNAKKMAQAIAKGIMGKDTQKKETNTAAANTEKPAEKKKERKVKVTAKSGLNCRKGPGADHGKVCAYTYGKVLTISEEKNGWGKTSKGWINLKYTAKA